MPQKHNIYNPNVVEEASQNTLNLRIFHLKGKTGFASHLQVIVVSHHLLFSETVAKLV